MTSEAPVTPQVPVPTDAVDPVIWHRLSVRMIAVHPVVELVRALPAVAVIVILGSQRGQGGLWSLVGVSVPIVLGLVRWATTGYRVTPDQVQVRRGLLRRSVVSVPRDRVRTVDLTSHMMHRLLGLTRLAVGTGQSDRHPNSSLVLDGLTTADAQRLRHVLLHGRPFDQYAEPAAPAHPSAQPWPILPPGTATHPARSSTGYPDEIAVAGLRPAWIWYGPFTMSGLVTLGVVVAFAWRLVNEADLDPQRFGPLRAVIRQLTTLPVPLAAAEVLGAGLVVVALASTVGYVLAFWNFRLTRSPSGTLHVSRGLVTTRSTTIEERRLRGVEVSQPLLLRAVRGARLFAITTGLRVGRGAERGGTVLLPPAPAAEATRVGAAVLGTADGFTTPLVRHPLAAARRRYTRVLLGLAALLAALAGVRTLVGWPWWPVELGLVLILPGLWLARDRYLGLGHAVLGRTLVFGLGGLVRRRYVLAGEGVIGVNLRRSFLQRRAGLVTLTATTAAGHQHYELLDVSVPDAVAITAHALPGVLTPFLTPAPFLNPPPPAPSPAPE
jgi:putative membrane protein